MEAVVSVDGRDAIDGRPADFRNKRGYLVPPWGSVDIEGWRISRAQAAAFRFSSVPDSYAARTGSAREVGVIGVAVFPERHVPRPIYRPQPYEVSPPPYSWDDYYRRKRSYEPAATRAKSSASVRGPQRAPDASPPPAPAPSADKSAGKRVQRSAAAQPEQPPPRAWAPNTARRSTRASTRSTSCARTPSYPRLCWACATTTATACWPWASRSTRITTRPAGYGYGGYDDNDLRRTAEPFPVADRRFAPPPPGWQRPCGWR